MKFRKCLHACRFFLEYFLTIIYLAYLEMLYYFKVQVLDRCLLTYPFHVKYYKAITHSGHPRKLLTEALAQKYRGSHPKVFCKTGVLETFAEFTGKHLCQSIFLNKVAG